MAKNRRYRWQNEKRAIAQQHARHQDHQRVKAQAGRPGAKLRYFELVSLHPLRYREVGAPRRLR